LLVTVVNYKIKVLSSFCVYLRLHADGDDTVKIITWQRAVWCKPLKAEGRHYLFSEKKTETESIFRL